MAKNGLEFQATILEAFPNASFKVEFMHGETKAQALCTISGKIRLHQIKIIPGDRVLIDISEYDLTKGRIIRRLV